MADTAAVSPPLAGNFTLVAAHVTLYIFVDMYNTG